MRIVFPPVYKSRYIHFVFNAKSSAYLVPLNFFLIYWVAPLLIILIPVNCRLGLAGAYTACVSEGVSLYLTDYIHFAFASTSTILTLSAYAFLYRLSLDVSNLAMMRKSSISKQDLIAKYKIYTGLPFRTLPIFIAGLIALMVAIVFINRFESDAYHEWWGNKRYGVAGLYYTLAIAMFVFLAVQYFIMILGVGIYLVYFSRKCLLIAPYHSDGFSGLSNAEHILVGIWRQAALIGACMLIVFYSNYLNIVDDAAIWALAAVSVVTIPFVAVVPFLALLFSAQAQKIEYKKRVLLEAFPRNTWGNSELSKSKLLEFAELSKVLSEINIVPLRAWKVAAIGLVNIVQLYVSFDAIIGHAV
jgi:hypothetical protein